MDAAQTDCGNAALLPSSLALDIYRRGSYFVEGGHGPVYVTFLPSVDAHNEPVAGEVMMTCSIHTETDGWERRPKETYQAKKQALTDAMLAVINDVLPIRRYVQRTDAGTPATYERYIGKTAVGGFPLTVRNAILRPKSVRSPLPDFYLAGEQSFPGPGTLSSALSGYHAARAILGGRSE